MNKVLAFVKKDFYIHTSYRLNLVLQAMGSLLTIASFYYLSEFIGGTLNRDVYGGDYFSFVLVGLALHDFSTTSLRVFSQYVRESQLAGTLEAVLSTQASLHTVILSSAVYPFVWTSFNVALYIFMGWLVFGLSLNSVNWIGAAVILMLSVVVLSGIGILSASFVLVFKRGDPLGWLLDSLTWLLGGVLYPVSVLPPALKNISAFFPIKYAIDGMRGAVLQNAPLSNLWESIWPLVAFGFIILPVSLVSFYFANKWIRAAGSMTEY